MRPPHIPSHWPNRAASRHVNSRPHLWHVQEMGAGPLILLLHGAGGATHSFRNLIPLLTPHYRVVAVDLAGQGFTVMGSRQRSGLDAMAEDVASLISHEGWQVQALIGHSAGAALSLRLSEILPVKAVVGINAALGKFEGLAGWLFPAMARVLAMTPMVAQLFSRIAGTPSQVHQLLLSTGSRIEPTGEAQYLHLLRMPSHVAATLLMMAQWELDPILDRLGSLKTPSLLITGANDRTVPPATSMRSAAAMLQAAWVDIPRFGHLVHEEAAEPVAALIRDFLAERAVL